MYASITYTIFPSITTGYGSWSSARNGAMLCTRSLMSRTYRIFESFVTKFEISGFRLPKRMANAARRTHELSATPPLPS